MNRGVLCEHMNAEMVRHRGDPSPSSIVSKSSDIGEESIGWFPPRATSQSRSSLLYQEPSLHQFLNPQYVFRRNSQKHIIGVRYGHGCCWHFRGIGA